MVLLALASASCWAQTDSSKVDVPEKLNKITFGLNFLGHGEICNGGLPRTDNKDYATEDRSRFLYGRTRLIIDYARAWKGQPIDDSSDNQPGLQAHVVIQNNAVWGMQDNMKLKMYEAWVKASSRNGLFAQLGRVALTYDDERIIGDNDFAMASLTHDVIRVGYEGKVHQVHAIFAYNQNGGNVYTGTYYDDGAQLYKTMQTVWYHYEIPKFPLGISLLFMNIGQQAGRYVEVEEHQEPDPMDPPRTEYQQMFGTYVKFHPKYLTFEASYYRQAGKIVVGEHHAMKIKAWMTSAKVTVNPSDRYGFLAGYDHLSGDSYVPVIYDGRIGSSNPEVQMVRHDVIRGFTPLYGSRTEFYGIMDYFYESAYTNGFTPGLQNAFVGAFGKPVSRLDCGLTYHYLAVATKLDGLNRTLGHSIELQANYTFSKDISLRAAYTFMFGTETMSRLKQGTASKHAGWGWFSLIISPKLFSTKW